MTGALHTVHTVCPLKKGDTHCAQDFVHFVRSLCATVCMTLCHAATLRAHALTGPQSQTAKKCEGVRLAYGRKTGGGSRKNKPNKRTLEIRELTDPYAPEALCTLVTLMRSSKDEYVRLTASKELLDRRYGKPSRQDGTGGGRSPHLTLNTQINNFGQQGPLSASDAYARMCSDESIVDVSNLLPLNSVQQESQR